MDKRALPIYDIVLFRDSLNQEECLQHLQFV